MQRRREKVKEQEDNNEEEDDEDKEKEGTNIKPLWYALSLQEQYHQNPEQYWEISDH